MITEEKLKEICVEYNINCKKLLNTSILEYGNPKSIVEVLDFLKTKLNIDSKNIEKASSVLCFGTENVEKNYRFLQKKINKHAIDTCLHILSTEHTELKKTYNYIKKEYGFKYLNKYTSILRVDMERIKDIENNFTYFNKIQTIQAAISTRNIEEIKKIVEVCEKNKIEISGTVFQKSAEEVEKIIEVCEKNEIEVSGTVFRRTADEIEKIIEICNENKIEPKGNVFLKQPDEIKKIIVACEKNKIRLTNSVFLRTADEIEDIVKVCKKIGIEPQGNVFKRTADEIETISEICEKNQIRITGSAFRRPVEEIQEIVDVCKKYKIKRTGPIFLKSADEIEKIVKVCEKNEIEITSSVFLRTAKEIEKIVKICKKNKIKITGSVFIKSADEIKKIVKVCNKNKINITGAIFLKTAKQLQDNIDYIKEEFGNEYLMPLIVSKNNKTLKKVLPYLREKGFIEYVKKSASILSLTLEQIQEREKFLEQQGQSIIDNKGKFNSIFGLSKKNYENRVAKTVERPSNKIAELVKDVTLNEVMNGKKIIDDITAENAKKRETIDEESR